MKRAGIPVVTWASTRMGTPSTPCSEADQA